MRLGAIFVAICMVIIAASAGATAYLYFGASPAEAATVAVALVAVLALYNVFATRGGTGTEAGHKLADLSHGQADLARQVAEMGRRLVAAEGRLDAALDRTRAATDPLAMEIGELGTLVKQVAESVAAHQTRLDAMPRAAATPAGVLAAEALAQRLAAEPLARMESAETPAPASETKIEPKFDSKFEGIESKLETKAAPETPAAGSAGQRDEVVLAVVRDAIGANRVDLYLQPIVTLPQRKVRYYEAMSRLRNERGEVLHAAQFIPQAESGGLMPKIDNLVIFRCVQVVRRLLLKNRDIGLFCNLSGATLTDSTYFPQFLEFMDANRAIASSLVLEFTQSAVRGMGPIEHESLGALAERGYRFSLDNVTDLRIEPRELANRGFRFIKVQASLLLNRAGTTASDIHPADLSDLVGRFGIDLIAEKIEGEGSVVDLLDYDVRYGQGFLFSPPRPVKAEALQGIADRTDVVARDAESPAPDRSGPVTGNSAQSAPSNGGARNAGTPATDPGKAERTTGLAQLARSIVSRS
jgi:cyclic-di-GMP phosphodiesterase, flagellum assembly factor TipF